MNMTHINKTVPSDFYIKSLLQSMLYHENDIPYYIEYMKNMNIVLDQMNNNISDLDESDTMLDLSDDTSSGIIIPKKTHSLDNSKSIELSDSTNIEMSTSQDTDINNSDIPLNTIIHPAKIDIVEKVLINVGGYKFRIQKKFLTVFNINLDNLEKINEIDVSSGNDIEYYFLDRDTKYFTEIVNLLGKYENPLVDIKTNISNVPKYLVPELVKYGIIDRSHKTPHRIHILGYKICPNEIIKINVNGKIIETYLKNIIPCNYLKKKLDDCRNSTRKIINISGDGYEQIKYLINILRDGLSDDTDFSIKLLEKYDVLYGRLMRDIIYKSHHSLYTVLFDYQIFEPIGDDKLEFGVPIKFSIDTMSRFLTNIMVCIDLPHLRDGSSYIDNIDQKIIKNAELSVDTLDKGKMILSETTGMGIFINSLTKNNKESVNLLKANNIVRSILYENHFIQINRILVSLDSLCGYGFNNNNLTLTITTCSAEEIIMNYTDPIPLLNVCVFGTIKTNIPKLFRPTRSKYISLSTFNSHNLYNEFDLYLETLDSFDIWFLPKIINKSSKNNICDGIHEIIFMHKDTFIRSVGKSMLSYYLPFSKFSIIPENGICYHSFNNEIENICLKIRTTKNTKSIDIILNRDPPKNDPKLITK